MFRILLIASSIAVLLPVAAFAAESPNFVVVMTDDQSWVGTSLQIDPSDPDSKSDYFRTPNIERLAKIGMSFTRGYSPAPYCCPTRRSLVIGQTPARHIYQRDQDNWTKTYRQQLSLPNMLKAANAKYRTAHFGKWDSRFDGVSPEEMGYDISDGKTGNTTGGGKGSGGPAAKDDPKLAFSLTNRTVDFMKEQVDAKRPFFVQVSHYAVHLDIFYRQETYDREAERAKGEKHTLPEFAAMTSDVDDAIGQLVDAIGQLGIKNSTYIFFLSDNGGRLTMPGQENAKPSRNHPLRGGKGGMYEGGLRVPFVAIGPNIKPGTVSRVPVTGLDLFPTMAELAGYAEPLPKALDGGTLVPVLANEGRGSVQRNNPFLVFHQAVARKAQSAIMQGDYKLVKTWSTKRIELFNLAQDKGEEKDLAETKPQKKAELHKQLVDFLASIDAATAKTTTRKKQRKTQ